MGTTSNMSKPAQDGRGTLRACFDRQTKKGDKDGRALRSEDDSTCCLKHLCMYVYVWEGHTLVEKPIEPNLQHQGFPYHYSLNSKQRSNGSLRQTLIHHGSGHEHHDSQ